MQPQNTDNEEKQNFNSGPHRDIAPITEPATNRTFDTPQASVASAPSSAPMPDPIDVASLHASRSEESVVKDEPPKYTMQTAHPIAEVEAPKANVSDLTLYLVVLFSGLSVIASASYLIWTVMTYFLTEPQPYSLFDLSTFNIYILIYLVLFGTLNILAALRLNKRVKEQETVGGALSTVGAIWRALLIVWGVSAVVGILYSPLSASIAGSEETGKNIAIDIVSALFALMLIAGFYWRDVLLHKVRSTLVPTLIIAVLVALVASVGAYATLNPKKATQETPSPLDYSSSFQDYDYDTSETDMEFDSSSPESDTTQTR